MNKPILLCILDGWGSRSAASDNAISGANTPCWDNLIKSYPNAELATSGLAVGLPNGQMGNSEVGHMNIGGGRIVMQNLPRIDQAISDGSLKVHKSIKNSIEILKSNGKSCHIMGLLSDGGVHAHSSHIAALAEIYADQGVKVYIHAFTDGRDTAPGTAKDFIRDLEKVVNKYDNISLATVSGRYYAMDRDSRWERVEKFYNAIVLAQGNKANTGSEAINQAYNQDQMDEFIEPYVIGEYNGADSGDVLVMANFRSDRARQTATVLLDPDFVEFSRKDIIFSKAIGMVEYSEKHNQFMDALFIAENHSDILGEVISNKGLKQLRIAETEKYAHVTFFFNGGKENEFLGEDRILIPSPNVATYDQKPEMSAFELTESLVSAIKSEKYDLIVVNYANTDMVGHTGSYDAAVKAVEAVDKCLDNLYKAINKTGGVMLITADHGNAEQMLDENGNPNTQHTTGPVPLVVVGKISGDIKLKNGRLCDIAPTILDIMNIDKPSAMNGETLITSKDAINDTKNWRKS